MSPVTESDRRPGITVRPRRLRGSPALRRLTAQHSISPSDLVLPLFVRDGLTQPRDILSMPGVVQHSHDSLRRAAHDAATAGIGGLMLFGIPRDSDKDDLGRVGSDPDGVLNRALRAVTNEVGDQLVVMADLCLDEFTTHGHCGVMRSDGVVDNDLTLACYEKMALAQAEGGAHLLGLSGMMDGQVAAVRRALDNAGWTDVGTMAYAAKYSSAFYGPFREAVASSLVGDRATYQMSPANLHEAIREVELDVAEGADLVVVKPASGYLDVVHLLSGRTPVPVAAYQVSGEYAATEAAAAHGWLDREAAILESLLSIRRAGATVILTYWALEAADLIRRQR